MKSPRSPPTPRSPPPSLCSMPDRLCFLLFPPPHKEVREAVSLRLVSSEVSWEHLRTRTWELSCPLAQMLLTAPEAVAARLAFGSRCKGTQLLASLWVSAMPCPGGPRARLPFWFSQATRSWDAGITTPPWVRVAYVPSSLCHSTVRVVEDDNPPSCGECEPGGLCHHSPKHPQVWSCRISEWEEYT